MDLPDFPLVFGNETHRLQGIRDWTQVALLGKENLEMLLHRARTTAVSLMAEGDSPTERRAIRHVIDHLSGLLENAPSKPLLPRLRIESFHRGQNVRIYIGDSEKNLATTPWISGVITEVEKAFRPDWDDGSPNKGYFWRWTATTENPIFADQRYVRFSTSEPRVLNDTEYQYLLAAADQDVEFRQIFVQNAYRAFDPLWCLELGIHSSGSAMDMEKWLSAIREQSS